MNTLGGDVVIQGSELLLVLEFFKINCTGDIFALVIYRTIAFLSSVPVLLLLLINSIACSTL